MSEEQSKKKLRLFVPTTFEGVVSVAILQEVLHENIELDVRYSRNIDFREYQLFSDVEMVMILGLPYRGYALPQEFFINVDAPFVDFIHSSTYGEIIPGDNLISVINEDQDPIKQVMHILEYQPEASILSKHITITDKARSLIEVVNSYRTWTWEGNNTTKVLLALYNASYTWLPRLVKGMTFNEMVKQYAPIIKGQFEKMNDYIDKKKSETRQYTVTIEGEPCILKVVYADSYINELANDLLNSEQSQKPIIVCVGRSTKSNDIFSIRTRIVHAGKVAYLINEGSGKDTVASVFSGIGYSELMGKAIIAALTQTNQ